MQLKAMLNISDGFDINNMVLNEIKVFVFNKTKKMVLKISEKHNFKQNGIN